MAEDGVVVDFATAPTATRLTITASIIANLLMLDVHYQEANHTQVFKLLTLLRDSNYA
jgi:hypothetical protein